LTCITWFFDVCTFLYFSGSSREFLQARKLLTSLRLFVKKKFSRSRRASPAYTQISKCQKYEDVFVICSKYRIYQVICWYCEFLYFAGSSREFIRARKYLTNLRLFVKKIFSRSRRASLAYTQISKCQKYEDVFIIYSKCRTYQVIFWYCEFLYFAGSSREFFELENVGQVSDGSSKKNFWNPAELLVLTHKCQKTQNMTNWCINY